MEIISVKYLEKYLLKVFFSNLKSKIIDFESFVHTEQSPMTTQFQDKSKFKEVYLMYGHLTWKDGQMDISAESIYKGEFDVKEKVL